jgi:hypothetical protein
LSFAIVEFDTVESRNAAFEANGSSIDGLKTFKTIINVQFTKEINRSFLLRTEDQSESGHTKRKKAKKEKIKECNKRK